MNSIKSINTKLEAYLLIHDPIKLLTMLYSKYGEIEEDRDLFYIDQLLYNKKSLYNNIFKEYQIIYNYDDFLRRYYLNYESLKRIPKLSDYYKNYYLFFCKPLLRNLKMTKIIQRNGNYKAEIFYKKNYESLSKNDENENLKENSLYSFDNITNNKTIFDKKIKDIIENTSSKVSLSLEDSEINKENYNLFTKRGRDDSFMKFLNNILNDKKENKNNFMNKNLYFPQNHKFAYKNKIKSSIYNLSKHSYRNSYNIEKNKKSLSPSSYHNKNSNINSLHKINPISKKNNISKPRNKVYNNSKNSNLSHFEKLSSTITNNQNSTNISKTMRNSLNNQNYKNNEKLNSKQNNVPNIYSSTSYSKNRKNSSVTFEKNSPKKNNKIHKLKSNSNFLNNNNNSTIRNQKRNYGSKFTLVKTPLSIIQSSLNKENNTNKISNFSYKNQTCYNNYSRTNNNSNASLSLKKSKKKEKSNKQEKNNKNINNINRRKNKSNIDNNTNISNRRNLKSSINNKILYPPNNNISNYKIFMKLNNINISSRNKKNIISQNQTNMKSLKKDHKISTISIDEEKISKNKNLKLDNKITHKSEINQKIVSQLDESTKRKNFSNNNKMNNNTMSSPNLNNEKQNKKIIESLNLKYNNLTNRKFIINNRDKSNKIKNINSPKK